MTDLEVDRKQVRQFRPDQVSRPFPIDKEVCSFVAISDPPPLRQLMAAFMLQRAGVIADDAQVVTRHMIRTSPPLRAKSFDLTDRGWIDPARVRESVRKHYKDSPDRASREFLRRLQSHYQRYFQCPEDQELKIGVNLSDDHLWPARSLHLQLSAIALAHLGDAAQTYYYTMKTLERCREVFCRTGRVKLDLKPAVVEVPFLKYDPHRVEKSVYRFPVDRMVLLTGMHRLVMVVGSPDAGKTSLVHGLGREVDRINNDLIERGVLGNGDFRFETFNADLASPVLEAMYAGKRKVNPEDKAVWDEKKTAQVVANLEAARSRNHLTLVDTPGKEAGRRFLPYADFVIHVERDFDRAPQPWDEVLAQPGMPYELASVETPIRVPGRSSGINRFESAVLGDRDDYISLVTTDLARVAERSDPVVTVLAHHLLSYSLISSRLTALKRADQLIKGFSWRMSTHRGRGLVDEALDNQTYFTK